MKVLAVAGTAVAVLVLVATGCGGSDEPAADASVPFDRAFIDAMVPHHEAAIEMATNAQAAGLAEPVLVDIAKAIVTTQQAEIDTMTKWRAEWFGSAEIDPDGGAALGMSEEMMGMQDAMDFEKAADVDDAFASAMIAHHKGAVTMAKMASKRAEREEIRTLAANIIATQEMELEQMKPFASSSGSMDGMDGMGDG